MCALNMIRIPTKKLRFDPYISAASTNFNHPIIGYTFSYLFYIFAVNGFSRRIFRKGGEDVCIAKIQFHIAAALAARARYSESPSTKSAPITSVNKLVLPLINANNIVTLTKRLEASPASSLFTSSSLRRCAMIQLLLWYHMQIDQNTHAVELEEDAYRP